MQPPQYDLRCSATNDKSMTHTAAAPSNFDTAITMRSAETQLRSTRELRAASRSRVRNYSSKIGSRRQSKKTTLKHFLKGMLEGNPPAPKLRPFHYDLRCPAAKDKSVTHAEAAPSNFDPAITMRPAETRKNVNKTTPEQSVPVDWVANRNIS